MNKHSPDPNHDGMDESHDFSDENSDSPDPSVKNPVIIVTPTDVEKNNKSRKASILIS